MAKAKTRTAAQIEKDLTAAIKAVGKLLGELRGTLPSGARDECDAAIAAIDALKE